MSKFGAAFTAISGVLARRYLCSWLISTDSMYSQVQFLDITIDNRARVISDGLWPYIICLDLYGSPTPFRRLDAHRRTYGSLWRAKSRIRGSLRSTDDMYHAGFVRYELVCPILNDYGSSRSVSGTSDRICRRSPVSSGVQRRGLLLEAISRFTLEIILFYIRDHECEV